MGSNRFVKPVSTFSNPEKKKRKHEYILIIVIIIVFTAITFAETRIIHFGADFPISNTILMFILININLLLLILLIFLVFRNLVKLLYDRKRKVMGAKLTTKLVFAFIALSLLPAIVLFFFSINFISSSIEFWFNVPVEQALENSLSVGRYLYKHVEENNRFFLKKIAHEITAKNLLNRQKALSSYVGIVQNSFNLHAVEIYSKKSKRLAYSLAPELKEKSFTIVSADNFQKRIASQSVLTISKRLKKNELIKSIGTVPFGAEQKDVKAFIVLTFIIPSQLYKNMDSISRGFEEYQQIKLLKKPIKTTYYITISIVSLVVVFCAVWFGIHLAKSISIPIRELGEGTRKVAEGDLSFRIGLVADNEIGSLVDSFNRMTEDLRISRAQLELSACKLREQNAEIEERRQYMEFVLKNISAGVITLNATGFTTTLNKSAEKMLNLKADEILNKSYKKLLKGEHLELAGEILENLSSTQNDSVELPLKLTVNGKPRTFMMHVNALKDDIGRHMGIVVVFDDLTDIEKSQRIAAWREIARRIAHEVKNPLTPIKLSAQRIKRRYSQKIDDPVFEECTNTIINHVDLIRNLVNEFSAFARFPTADPKLCVFPPIIEEAVALYRESHQHIDFEISISENIPSLMLDRQQLKQAMINLLDNAVASVRKQGKISIKLTYDPILRMVRLEVADNGAGISDERKTHLFEPYFSTKKSGMGLGLTIVSTIIADHNGMISVQDNQPQGAKFVIELPVQSL